MQQQQQKPNQIIGAISAATLARWHATIHNKENLSPSLLFNNLTPRSDGEDNDDTSNNNLPYYGLTPVPRNAEGLDRVAFVSIERRVLIGNKKSSSYHHRLVEHPVSPASIRGCLLASIYYDDNEQDEERERAELQRMDLAPGLVRFQCTTMDCRVHYRVKTWHIKMMHFHLLRQKKQTHNAKATWCTWKLLLPGPTSDDSTTTDLAEQTSLQFWTGPVELSLSRFVTAYLALTAHPRGAAAHYTAEISDGLIGSWTWGTIQCGDHSAGFYRLAFNSKN